MCSSDLDGWLTHQSPEGTVHQTASATVFHWCNPNIVVYQTATGIVYYDDLGLTFRSEGGVAHFGANGEVIYHGEGGITHQFPDGRVTLWTPSGALYKHADGSVSYVPTGSSRCRPLSTDLGEDPFPGPPLTKETSSASRSFAHALCPFARAHCSGVRPSKGECRPALPPPTSQRRPYSSTPHSRR